MKRIVKTSTILLVLTVAIAAYAQSVTCPIDRMSMYFTGNTQVEMGKLLYEYKCPNDHITWIVKN